MAERPGLLPVKRRGTDAPLLRTAAGLAVLAAAMLGAGCSADPGDGAPASPTSSAAAEQAPTTPNAEGSAAPGTPDTTTGPPRRRTTTQDVALTGPEVPQVGTDYGRAAVPVDAWPAARVLIDADDSAIVLAEAELTEPGWVAVVGRVEACTLISAWALPHPSLVVVGYEPHPTVTCIRAADHALLFVLPAAGVNSEGSWAYRQAPEVLTQLRAGS